MPIENMKLLFPNNPDLVYIAGETVEGLANFTVTHKPFLTRGVKIWFKGEACVQWKEIRPTKKSRRKSDPRIEYDYFKEYESYFKRKYYLCGDGDEMHLQPDDYSFPFSFQLPVNAPSSFQGDFGYVCFSVKVVIDRDLKAEKTCKAFFTVIGRLDLNGIPDASTSDLREKSKTFCCLCCRHGPLTVRLSIPRRGFVAGEAIQVSGDIENSSSEEICKTKLDLRQRIFYKAVGAGKEVESVIQSYDFPGPNHEGSKTLRNFQIPLPALPPTNLAGCSIIRISYEIRYLCFPSNGLASKVMVSLPVTIGTIPLREIFPTLIDNQERSVNSIQCAASSESNCRLYLFNEYPDLPPASYAEAVHCSVLDYIDSDNDMDDDAEEEASDKSTSQNYIPKYLVFAQKKLD